MFECCKKLEKLIFCNNFSENIIIKLNYLFSGCESLEELNLENLSTNKVINMCYMFNNCKKLKKVNV